MKLGLTLALTLAQGLAVLGPLSADAAVLANIGERTVTEDMVHNEYGDITSEQRKAINADEMTRRNIIDSTINSEVLVLAAKKAGLDKDEEYKKALSNFERQYLSTKFMQKAIEPKLAKASIKKFWDENKNFFDSTQVCASHIVMQDQEEANKVGKLAKGKGAKFEELAKKHSLDPSVQENSGNLGCFTRDKMVPEFAAAAFDMHKGEIKGPIHTMYGFHVLKVYDIKTGKVPGYDEIEQKVKETYRLKLVNELINELRAKSSVKVNEEAVKKFKL